MQYEGRGKAAKVDENVAKWTKICRSTVLFRTLLLFSTEEYMCLGCYGDFMNMLRIEISLKFTNFLTILSNTISRLSKKE